VKNLDEEKMKLFMRRKEQLTPQEAITKLRDTSEMLEKRVAWLENKKQAEVQNARQNVQKNKRAALASLKRRRLYEVPLCQDAAPSCSVSLLPRWGGGMFSAPRPNRESSKEPAQLSSSCS
jgi:hypothetical protein